VLLPSLMRDGRKGLQLSNEGTGAVCSDLLSVPGQSANRDSDRAREYEQQANSRFTGGDNCRPGEILPDDPKATEPMKFRISEYGKSCWPRGSTILGLSSITAHLRKSDFIAFAQPLRSRAARNGSGSSRLLIGRASENWLIVYFASARDAVRLDRVMENRFAGPPSYGLALGWSMEVVLRGCPCAAGTRLLMPKSLLDAVKRRCGRNQRAEGTLRSLRDRTHRTAQ